MLTPKDMFRIDYGPDEHSHKIFKKEDENNLNDDTKSYIARKKRLTPDLYEKARKDYKNSLAQNPHLTADQFHEISGNKYAANKEQIHTLINDPKKRDFKYNSIALIDPNSNIPKQIKDLPEDLKSKLAGTHSHNTHTSFSYKTDFNDLMKLETQDEKDIYLKHMQICPYGNGHASLILATKFASNNSAHNIHDKLLNSRFSSRDKVPVIHELMYNPNISKENKKIIYDKEANSASPVPTLQQYKRFVE